MLVTGSSAIVTITEPEQSLEATLDNLLPFTTYYITLSASTVAGTGSGPAINLTTGESGMHHRYSIDSLILILSIIHSSYGSAASIRDEVWV